MRQTEGLYRFSRLVVQLAIGAAALALALGVLGYLFFMRAIDLPEAHALAERELTTGMLRFGERVARQAHVYVRRSSDYFRGANGVLAATNERLIFIGVAPKGTSKNPDAPPVIIQQLFVNDTSLSLEPRRVFFGTARGVVVRRDGHEERYGATGRHWHELEELADYVNGLHEAQRRAAAREAGIRAAVQRIEAAPLYYRIRRGDAISTIANWFGISAEDLQRWNGLEGPRIRTGDSLLVRPARTQTSSSP